MSATRLTALIVFAGLTIVGISTSAQALEISVTVDSSSIPDSTPGSLDFQFSAGAPTAQTAQVVISDFQPTAMTLGGNSFTNSTSGGPLPTDVTILNNPAVLNNRANQGVTFGTGSGMSFTLIFSGNALTTSGTADSTFYFSILNASSQSIFGEYSLPHLAITIPANGSGVPFISSIRGFSATVVPEPGSLILASLAVAILILSIRRGPKKPAAVSPLGRAS